MEERDNVITLVDEDGVEQDFEVIMTLEVENNEYAILLSLDDNEEDAYIFKIINGENDDFTLVAVDDDEEYENVVAAYEAIMNEEEEK